MSKEDQGFSVWGFIKGFGKLLIGFLLLLQGLIGLAVLLLFVGVIVSASNGISGAGRAPKVTVEPGSALLLNPNGVLVEQAPETDPFQKAVEAAYGIDEPSPVEVGEIIHAIRLAADDSKIAGMVLDVTNLSVSSSSASKLHDIAAALDAFRAKGKKIYSVGDYYGQEQYLLAAHADEIYMHDYGNIILYGYGAYEGYIKSLLEKLKVTTHVFRVGTFKAAVEPFLRDDMSSEAKEANLAFINVLWDEYARSVEQARKLPQGAIKQYANSLGALLEASKGDLAKAALDYKLVDGLKTRSEQLDYLKGIFGESKGGSGYKNVSFDAYAAANPRFKDGKDPNVAIITAAGTIVDGEAGPGEAAAGDTIADYLKQAREDDNVKAVVLRVDSPGGSAFASEIIRDGILALKDAGKPVVVSMGSLAASGGYWISAPADEIFAAPTTITGSIGIFGLFMTLENSAAAVGVYTDGVGTTSLSPILVTGLGPLPPEAADIIQKSIEDGYDKFLQIVSEGRKLDPGYIDSVGQGRVWIGSRAQELKLVDSIGTLDDAIAAAAKRANLEKYDVVEIVKRVSPFEKIFGNVSATVTRAFGLESRKASHRGASARRLVKTIAAQLNFFDSFNDPNGAYARCIACEMN